MVNNMRKIGRNKRKKKKKMVIILSLSLLMILTVGYAAFSSNLSITAKGNIKKYTLEDYVIDGLFAFYDGTENTSSGHGAPTDTWYNKALDLNPTVATTAKSTMSNFNTSSWTNDNGLLFNGNNTMIDTGYMQSELGQSITFEMVSINNNTENFHGYFGEHFGDGDIYTSNQQSGIEIQYHTSYLRIGYWSSENGWCGVTLSPNDIQNYLTNKKSDMVIVFEFKKLVAVYINGNNIATENCSYTFNPATERNLIIGRSHPSQESNRYFEGTMYNFMVYKKVLTEGEIKQNYRVNKQRYWIE